MTTRRRAKRSKGQFHPSDLYRDAKAALRGAGLALLERFSDWHIAEGFHYYRFTFSDNLIPELTLTALEAIKPVFQPHYSRCEAWILVDAVDEETGHSGYLSLSRSAKFGAAFEQAPDGVERWQNAPRKNQSAALDYADAIEIRFTALPGFDFETLTRKRKRRATSHAKQRKKKAVRATKRAKKRGSTKPRKPHQPNRRGMRGLRKRKK